MDARSGEMLRWVAKPFLRKEDIEQWNLMADYWQSFYSPKLKKNNNSSILWVSKLMNAETNSWDLQILKGNFQREEVKNILLVPTSFGKIWR